MIARLVRLISVLLLGAIVLLSQGPIGFQYFYDDLNQLIKVIDSTGVVIDYSYDAVGNITQITRSTLPAGALSIFNFTPQQGGPGASVNILGQGFSSTPASDIVKFNGSVAPVVSASPTSLMVTVPGAATTGPITVTVNGQTVASSNNFTFLPVPDVISVSPKSVLASTNPITIPNLAVTGVGLTGSTFSFVPGFTVPPITINSAAISPDGMSATLNITISAGASGSFTLVATNGFGSSSGIATPSNTFNVLAPDGDADGDGLTNAVEIAIGTDPLNPQTSGAGLPDGWQVFYGINPLDPSVANQDLDNSGLTVLQDYQMGLSPRNPNRIPPTVSQVTPANGATNVFQNGAIVVRFAEPLLTGVSLSAAQTVITSVLGTTSGISLPSQTTAAQTLQAYLNRTCCGSSVVSGVVSLVGPSGGVAGTVGASSDGLSVTFSTNRPALLQPNATYNVQVQNLRDAAGNPMVQVFRSAFTTGNMLDITPPQISLTVPANNASGVPTNVHYTVQFTKAIDPSTLSAATFSIVDTTSSVAVAGLIQVDASGLTAAFIPDQPLPVGRSFTVSLTTGIQDTSGNSLVANTNFSFTTAFTPETTPPHLVTNSPTNGQTGIPVNALIDLGFNEPLNIITVGPNSIQVSTGGQTVPVLFALSNGNQRVTITPAQGLVPNAQYTVTLGAAITSLSGLHLDNPGSFTFQSVGVVDPTPPTVTSVDPANDATGVPLNALVEVHFNKPMDLVTLTSSNIELYPISNGLNVVVPGMLIPSPDGSSAVFMPTAPLQAETQYGVFLTGVTDLKGTAVGSGTYSEFTTGAGTQTTAPTVVAVTPPNGSTGAPVNAAVQVQVSAPVSVVSVGSNAVTLTAGSTPVAGTVSASGSLITFTPAAPLAVSTAYTVAASGFTDLAGNPVTAFSSSFTTGSSAVADTTQPTVISVVPANAATNVPVNSTVVVTFSKTVNPLTVGTGTVGIASGATLAGTYAVSGAVVTFTPLTPFPGNATVSVSVNGVTDLAGNANVGFSSSFSTAATADTTPPTIVSVTPANGATGIGPNGQVVITFSKSMNPGTLTACCSSGFYNNVALFANGSRLSFTPSVSSDNRTLVLSNLAVPVATTISVIVTHAVQDLSGNALADFQSQFTTAPSFDTSHASVVNQRPGNGATGVAVTSGVTLFVSKPLNAATVSNALHVSQNGQLVVGTVNVTNNGQTVEFTPAAPLQNGALIQVFLDTTATDTSGNTVNSYQGSFSTVSDPATTAPGVVNDIPVNGSGNVPLNAVVEVAYSELLSAATVNATNVTLVNNQGNAPVASTVSLDTTGMVIRLVPNAALAASTTYCYSVSGVQGANGQAAQNFNACFVTGASSQTVAPTVVAVSPKDQLGNVPTNANIRVQFSGPIDPMSVNGTTIQVSGGGQPVTAGSISFSNGNQIVQITPQSVLPASTVMTLAIAGVQDVAGNAVTTQTTHFTTAATPQTFTISVVGTNPVNGASNVPVNAAIAVQTNAAIDPTTLVFSDGSFGLYDNTLAQYTAGIYSQSSDGLTTFLAPTALLATGRAYRIALGCGNFMDLVGNGLGCNFYSSFTSGFATSTTAPQVTAVSPGNGVTQVPINGQVTIQFNEPVNPQTIGQVTLKEGGAPVNVIRSLGNGNQTLTLIPEAALLGNTLYTVTITGVGDVSGNAMSAPVTTTFTTAAGADFTQPVVTLIDPTSGSTGVPTNPVIRVRFNKQVAVTSSNVEVYPITVGLSIILPGTLVVSADGLSASFTLAAPLQVGTQYGVYLTGITDVTGAAVTTTTYSEFTTGTGTQTTAPTVVAVTPPNGSTGAPVNAAVQVQVSAPVSVVSVGSNAVTLTAGSTPVAGTVSASGSLITFTPAAPLAVSTAYTVAASGFTDLAGNPVTAFSSSFTTGSSAVADTTQPTVISVVPANAATNVPVNSTVVVTFSKTVNPLTVGTGTVGIASGATLAGTYAVSGAVVTFTPLTPFPGNATVSVSVNGVTDLAGNANVGFSSSFSTAATADTTPPTIVSVTPANGATGIGPNGQVVITFSKSMNPGTLTACCSSGFYNNVALFANGSRLSFTPSVSSDNRTLVLSNLAVPVATTISVIVTHAVQDLSGNALADFQSQFTTAPSFDTSHASVVNQRPGNGATGVAVTSGVTLFVSKPLNAATVSNALHVSQNGQLVVGTVNVTNNGQTVEFTPAAPLQNGALIQVFLDTTATDTSGNTVNSYQGSFSTVSDPATTAPGVVNDIPVNGSGNVPLNAVVEVAYSELLSAATVNATNVTLVNNQGNAPVASTVSLDTTGMVIRLVPNAALAASTTYCYSVSGVQGANGQAAQNFNACFVTGASSQTVAPTVVAVSPKDQLGNVPTNANIRVQFSGPIDPMSVNGTTIQVSGGGQPVTAGSISFSNGNQIVQITPQSVLPASTVMTLAIAGVQDVAGNAVTTQTTHFTTAATPQTFTISVVGTNPVNGASNVPVNAAIAVQTNAAIDPTTLVFSDGSFGLYDNTLAQYTAGIYSQSSDGLTTFLAPTALLATGRAYRIALGCGNFMDLVGNGLGCNFYSSFTSGFATSTTAPQVTAVSPGNGVTQVPINGQVTIQFNEPVNPQTIGQVTLKEGGAPVNVIRSLGNGNQTLTLIPEAALLGNTLYTVTITGVGDVSGNAMSAPVTTTFTTAAGADFTQPVVTLIDPTSGSTGVPTNPVIRVRFNKQVAVTSSNVEVYPITVGLSIILPGTLVVSADGLSASFTLAAPLQVGTQYGVYLTGITDVTGAAVTTTTYSEFTTGTGTQTTAPTVVAVTPPNGSTGAPVNAAVQVQVSAPVSVVSVGSNAVTLTAGSTPVAGTVSASGSLITFTPAAPLAVSTAYTVAASGFTDLAGNPVTAFSSSFTTGSSAVADTTQPTVISVVPANAATNVPVNSTVVVTFSKTVNPLTVGTGTVGIASGATLAGTYAVSGAVVTFTPLTPFPGNATVSVSVNGVTDLAGNANVGFSSSFSTAATADTTPPTIVSVTPANGATGIGPNGQVVITFSKSMNPGTLTACCSSGFYNNVALFANGSRLSFTPSVSSDNRTLVLSNLAVPVATTISVIVTHAVQDLSGNALADFQSQFTTAPSFDTSHASVVNQRPGNGATGVAVTSGVTLFVSKPLNAATVSNALHVSQNGQLVVGTVNVTNNGQTVEFTPAAPLQNGALIQVFLDTTATDTSGNTVNSYQGSFSTVSDPATTAPGVVNDIPVNGSGNVPLNAVVEVAYSELLSAATVNATNVTLVNNQGNAPVASTVSLDTTGMVIRLVPNAALAASTTYCYSVSGVQGANGQAAQNFNACFVTGASSQTVAPTVVAVSPKDQLGNVPTNANIRVQFSGPIDPMSVNGTTIQVSGGGQPVTAGSISFSNGNQIVQITPQSVLPASTVMTLAIAGVQDVAGNAVTTQTTHFTTAATPQTFTISVVGTNPVNGASNVPVNAAIAVQTNAAIDPTTLVFSDGSFGLYDNTLAQYTAGIYSQSSDGLTTFLAPTALLATGRAYRIALGCGNFMDLVGNGLGCNFYSSFTSGFATSTTAPQVTAVSPGNGVTQVPINGQVTIQFNEPVNPQTIGQVTLKEGGAPVNVIRSLGNGNQTLTLIPEAALLGNTLYTVTITGVGDVSGNAMSAPVTTTFTTAAGADFTQPVVTLIDPTSGSTGVPTNPVIRVRFNKQVAVTSSNVEVYPITVGLSIILPGTLVVSVDGLSASFTLAAPLQVGTQYGVYLTGITDVTGAAVTTTTYSEFTTGTGTQTTAPTVVAVTPPNGSTGAPVNAAVQVQVSAPVSVVSVGSNAVTLTAGSTPVAGTVSASGSLITFTPAAPLAVSTAYTVAASGFTDLAGNPVTAFSSSFTTGSSAVADTTQPTVISVVPANAATNVPVNSTVVVTFSKTVNPLTVGTGTVGIASGATLAGTYAVSGAVVTFTPLTPFPGNATVSVSVNGVTDLAGNANVGFSSSFSTAATADTTPPTIVSVTPANGATGIGPNGQVVITFSKSMNPGTLTACCSSGFYNNVALFANGSRLSFTPSVSSDNRTLVLSNLAVPVATTISVIVTHAVQDLSGNALADFQSQFTTAPSFDTSHASVVNQRPGNGATGVAVTSGVTLFVSKPLNAATVSNALHVSQNGQLVVGTVNVTNNGQTVEFTPAAPLQNGALIQVFLDTTATDTSGNTVNSYQGSFSTVSDPATTAPGVVNDIPVNGSGNVPLNAVVEVAYSELLSAATVNATNVTLVNNQGNAPVASTVSLDTTGMVIRLVPNAALAASTTYCYSVSGVQGANGQAAQNFNACFVTGASSQTVAPTVVAVSPKDQLGNVPTNANIRVQFSGPIDPMSVNGTTIQVSGGGQPVTAGSISFSNGNQIVQITPQSVLPASTVITLAIAGVQDVAGNAVAAQTTQFTTAATPQSLNNVVVVNTNPPSNSTNIPLNVAISVQTNAEIDPTTVNVSTFTVHDNVLNQNAIGSYSQSADGMTLYFVPSGPLATGRSYTVSVDTSGTMIDLVGNQVNSNFVNFCCGYTFSFTTGVTASTMGPVVTGVSPGNGMTQVPINAQVMVQFNEPVDVETIGQVTLTAGANLVNVSRSLGNGNQLLTLTPASALSPNIVYTITVAGVTDLSGIQPLNPPVVTTFTTGSTADFLTPQVASVIPLNGAIDVPTNASILIQFNKPVNPLTVTNSSFTVSLASGMAIAGTILVAPSGTGATFMPSSPLLSGTTYTVSANAGITDLAGQSLTAFQSTFTTN